jgi:hypothetical protein
MEIAGYIIESVISLRKCKTVINRNYICLRNIPAEDQTVITIFTGVLGQIGEICIN